jgi:hypothetical protein
LVTDLIARLPGDHMSAHVPGESERYDVYEDVQARLAREFPNVPVSLIQAVVGRWVRSFDGARVTLYLPILVERASRDELARRARAAGAEDDRRRTVAPTGFEPALPP